MVRDSDVRNAEQWVFQHIRECILDGTLSANEEINQTHMANRLGVSRSPVRDALRRLESTGLVTIKPNQRAVVTSFTLASMYEIFEMRAALEGLGARHACSKLSESDLIELDSFAQIMLRVTDLETYLANHEAFHDLVARRSAMPRLRRELARLREMATPYLRIYGADRHSAELTGDRHDALVEVLRLRDPGKAEQALVRHVRHAYEQLAESVLRLTVASDQHPPQQGQDVRGEASRHVAGPHLTAGAPD